MLARLPIPADYQRWNRRWGAPRGRKIRKYLPASWHGKPGFASLVGRFAFQPNNTTRAFEYPWAIETMKLSPGMSVLEIGGSLSGLQFVLDHMGCRVTNVDPGEEARGRGWPVTPAAMAVLNKRFASSVELHNCFLEQAKLPDNSFDRVLSISVIEHVPEPDVLSILSCVRRLLKPGGLFVITLDLFLDVFPFTEQVTNQFGKNISVRWLVENSGLTLLSGDKRDLFGYEEFDAQRVLRERSSYLVGDGYPALVQAIVLEKPESAS